MQTHGLQPIRFLCLWDFPGKYTGVGCHFLLQGIFLAQGSNPHLLHLHDKHVDILSPMDFPGGSVVVNLPTSAGDTRGLGSIPGLRRSLGEGNGNPLQYSCLGNPIDREAWRATVLGVARVRQDLATRQQQQTTKGYRRELIASSPLFRHFSVFPGSDNECLKMTMN